MVRWVSAASEPKGNWHGVTGEPFDYTHWRVGGLSNPDGIKDALHFCDNPINSHVRSS